MNLDFQITECPEWREDKTNYSPPVTTMLKDIVKSIKKWEVFKKQEDQKLQEIKVKYIVHTQTEEGIGVKSQKETADIINKIYEKRLSIKRNSSNGSDDFTVGRLKPEDENNNRIVELLRDKDVSDKKIQETVNLYKAFVYLEKLTFREDCSTEEEMQDLDKLLEVEECFRKSHEILLFCLEKRNLVSSAHVHDTENSTNKHTIIPILKKSTMQKWLSSVL